MVLIIQIALGIVLAVAILRYWQAILKLGLVGVIGVSVIGAGFLTWHYGAEYIGVILALMMGLVITYGVLKAVMGGSEAVIFSTKLLFFRKSQDADGKVNTAPIEQAEAEGGQSLVNEEGRQKLVEAEGRLAFQNNLLLLENPYPRNTDRCKHWEHGYLLAKQEREALG